MKNTKAPREVYVVSDLNGYFVYYVKRRKHQRYLAAQFDLRNPDETPRTLEQVEAWVESKPKLKLT